MNLLWKYLFDNQVWGIDTDYLEAIEQFVAAGDATGLPKLHANTSPENERPKRGDVLEMLGPIVPRARGVETSFGETSSVEKMIKAIEQANSDDTVSAIGLYVDSPGGQIDGVWNLMSAIKQSAKPVHVYVDGMCASAAYMASSGAASITAAPTAKIGSVGAMCMVRKRADDGSKIFISSQSPLKNEDPFNSTDAAKRLQSRIDDAAALFIDTVAVNRKVTSAYVAENHGRGSLLSAAKAVEVGMIDGIETLASFMGRLCCESVSVNVVCNEAVPVVVDCQTEGEEMKSEEYTKGYSEAADHFKSVVARVIPVLRSSEYSVIAKEKAFACLEGRLTTEAFEAVISVFDEQNAISAREKAVDETRKEISLQAPSIQEPVEANVKNDGVISTYEDLLRAAKGGN